MPGQTMDTTAEILHDRPVDDATQWQSIASLARCLGIAERTVRWRVKQGTVERLGTPDGRVYYRAPTPAAATGIAGSDLAERLPAIVATHVAAVTEAHRQLAQVRENAAAITATHLATLERLADERERLERIDRERQDLARQLQDERERLALFASLATAPWYAFRMRRRLRRQLQAG